MMTLLHNILRYFVSHNNNMKLVLIVRTDIGMKKGKIASQCAHAAVACYKQGLSKAPQELKMWEFQGQPKIVLKSDSSGEECLSSLLKQAEMNNLVCALVRDAGHTQVEKGSITVLGIGPGKASTVDEITSHLKLL